MYLKMHKQFYFLFLFFVTKVAVAQYPQLHYSGTNPQITEAVLETNKLLRNPDFYAKIDSIKGFDNTQYSGARIISEMKAIETIEVSEYHKRYTKTTAKTQTSIRMNTAKLERYTDPLKNLASLVNTLIHETIHAVDWTSNMKWDYTHRTQYEERPPVSAPYVIGAIAEDFLN